MEEEEEGGRREERSINRTEKEHGDKEQSNTTYRSRSLGPTGIESSSTNDDEEDAKEAGDRGGLSKGIGDWSGLGVSPAGCGVKAEDEGEDSPDRGGRITAGTLLLGGGLWFLEEEEGEEEEERGID